MPDLVWEKGVFEPKLLETPMPPYRMIAYIRLVLTRMVEKQSQIPEELARTLTTHSCKVTLLSWSAQAQVPEPDRCLLGHHKPEGGGMVAKYARDDTVSPLATQTLLAQKIREGWRPRTPQLRGSLAPLEPTPELKTAPPWKGPTDFAEQEQEADKEANTTDEETSSSSSSSEAESTQAQPVAKGAPRDAAEGAPLAFIFNKAKDCLHIGVECSEDIPLNRRVHLEGNWWKVACGALLTSANAYSLTQDCSVATNLCGRRGCRNAV